MCPCAAAPRDGDDRPDRDRSCSRGEARAPPRALAGESVGQAAGYRRRQGADPSRAMEGPSRRARPRPLPGARSVTRWPPGSARPRSWSVSCASCGWGTGASGSTRSTPGATPTARRCRTRPGTGSSGRWSRASARAPRSRRCDLAPAVAGFLCVPLTAGRSAARRPAARLAGGVGRRGQRLAGPVGPDGSLLHHGAARQPGGLGRRAARRHRRARPSLGGRARHRGRRGALPSAPCSFASVGRRGVACHRGRAR